MNPVRKPGFVHGLLAALSLSATLAAQHPSPIPISDIASPERRIFDAKISPDGAWVADPWVIQNTFSFETRLGLRRADGTSTSTTLVHVETGGTAWPPLSFTWRWDGQRSSLLYVDVPAFPTGFIQLNELVPGTGPLLTRAFQAAPPLTQEAWFLQRQPCGNVLTGVAWRPTTSNLWSVNLAGTGVVTLTSHAVTSTSSQLVALDTAPNGSNALYAKIISSVNVEHYDLDLVGGGQQPVLVGSAFLTVRMAGYLDNQTWYGNTRLTSSTPQALIRSDVTGPTYISNSAFLDTDTPAAEPAHLGGSGTKRFLAFVGRESVANAPAVVRLMPTVYGGDISLFEASGAWTNAFALSGDRSSARVAFVAEDSAGDRQVHVVPTNREVEVTFTHPIGANNVTYAATAPCALNETCILAAAQGLMAPPIPWGPPGQIDLDPASAVILNIGSNAPVSAQFTLPVNPAFLGVPFYFQAIRSDAVGLNSSRPARVRYL